jgi:hypothetical protein
MYVAYLHSRYVFIMCCLIKHTDSFTSQLFSTLKVNPSKQQVLTAKQVNITPTRFNFIHLCLYIVVHSDMYIL